VFIVFVIVCNKAGLKKYHIRFCKMALVNIDFHVFSLKLKLFALGCDHCVFRSLRRITLQASPKILCLYFELKKFAFILFHRTQLADIMHWIMKLELFRC